MTAPNSLHSADIHELTRSVNEQTVRGLQVLQVAMMAGPIFFAGAVLFKAAMPDATPTGSPESVSLMKTLSAINLLLALIAYRLGPVIFRWRLRTAARVSGGEADTLLEALRSGWIVRLGLAEGAAVFGAAVCFLGQANGILRTFPVYWFNLLTVAAVVVFGAATFPTRTRLVEALRQNLT
jgi:hypothetical protein